jgi:8-oxo-dGTP diphosphatase
MVQKPFTLSVKVVIRDADGRCLLLRRAQISKGNPGKWEFPGGKVALGEEFEQVVQREVSEETNLTICLQRALGTAQADLPARKVIYLILEAELVEGAVQLSIEHDAYDWRYPHELLDVDLVRHFIPFVRRYALGEV